MSTIRFPVAAGAAHVEADMLANGRVPYDLAPEGFWHTEIRASHFAAATQTLTITIPSAGLVDGEVRLRLVGTDTAGDAVDVTATGVFDTDEDGTAAALEAAIGTLRGTTLATVVDDESVTDNVVTVELLAGTSITATLTYVVAPLWEAAWSGTFQDDVAYGIQITEEGEDSVDTYVTRTSGTPADASAMAVAMEAALEAAAGLSSILDSADDTTGTNAIQFVAGVTIDTVEAHYVGDRRQTFTNTVGGTAAAGDYVLGFIHPSLPNVDGEHQVNVTFTRTSETNDQIAAGFEAAIEAEILLADLIASADDSSNVNTIIAAAGVTGLQVVNVADPGTGTLTVAETTPTITITDESPAGPTVTLTSRFTLDLATHDPGNEIPVRVAHFGGYFDVKTAFAAGTLYLDRGTGTIATDYIATADATSATAQGTASTSEAHYGVMATNTARVHLIGATAPPTAGRCHVLLVLAPLPEDLTA